MRKLALALAATAVCGLSISSTTPARAAVETVEAQMTAASAASIARQDMIDAFGEDYVEARVNSCGATCRRAPARNVW